MTRKRIAVLFGGRSAEHEISILTAVQAMSAFDVIRYRLVPVYLDPNGAWWTGDALLDKANYPIRRETLTQVSLLPEPSVGGLTIKSTGEVIPIDVCLLAFHGQFGEDGAVQGLLDLADIPYTSCGVLASALAMHKGHCKALLSHYGIPLLPWATVSQQEAQYDLKEVDTKVADLGPFPLFVKPVHLGSSIAIGRADDREGLHSALAQVFKHDTLAIVEPCVHDLLEINISVLEGVPSPVEVPVASETMLTYEDKYMRGGKNKGEVLGDGMASLTRVIDPPDLCQLLKKGVTDHALAAYRILECRGVVRFDFIVDTSSNSLYFNELNSLPGSLSFYLWEQAKPRVLYTELLNKLIAAAERRHARSCYVQRDLGFKALQPT